MGVGFQIPIKNLVLILISTAVKTARVVSLSGLKTLSFPLTGYSYESFSLKSIKALLRWALPTLQYLNFYVDYGTT